MISGMAGVKHDVIPYGLVQAPRGELDGLNLVGLKRKGVARSDITALRAAFQMLAQGEGTFHCMLAGLTARIVIDADAADIENQVHEPLVPDHRVGTEKFDMGDPFAIGPPDEFAVGVHTEV